jgi:hypothetical protein
MRIPQLEGQSGSLRWMQRLATQHSLLLEASLQSMGVLSENARLQWLSPLPEDLWAQYRDETMLGLIGRYDLADKLAEFWPKRGPQWDGVATDGAGQLLLFDAKAHRDELESSCHAGSPAVDHIRHSLDAAKTAYGADPAADWLNGHFRYAERLAHLQFFLDQKVKARLIFIYFTDDPEMQGGTYQEWKMLSRGVAADLGLKGRPVHGVVNVFMDSRTLA